MNIQGKIWVLADKTGRLIEDIDTDQIFHNAHLHITEIAHMGQYALGNLEGWTDFAGKAGPGDVIIAGRNFGAGSSRQQAVDCFIALKTSGILAPSYSSIYFRNAVNSAFPVLKCSELECLVETRKLETGDMIRINFHSGEGLNTSKNISFQIEPMSPVQADIFRAGNLFAYGKTLSKEKRSDVDSCC